MGKEISYVPPLACDVYRSRSVMRMAELAVSDLQEAAL